MEIQKKDSQENPLIKNLNVAIIAENKFDVSRINKMGIAIELRKFKNERGGLNYPELFKIPLERRICEMAKKDLKQTITTITVALTLAFETMNLVRKMNAIQILDLAETIVDASDEGDRISIEDLMLFLQKLTRGEYPEIYEGIDQVKFMARLSSYRDERWEVGKVIAENKHLEYKAMGDPQRAGSKMTAIDEHLSQFTTKLSNMKDELQEKKAENKRLRDQQNF